MEYKIITSIDSEKVAQQVMEHVKDGWKLYGSLQTAGLSEAARVNYSQALIKYEEEAVEKPARKPRAKKEAE